MQTRTWILGALTAALLGGCNFKLNGKSVGLGGRDGTSSTPTTGASGAAPTVAPPTLESPPPAADATGAIEGADEEPFGPPTGNDVIAAAKGADRVEPMAPTWCAGYPGTINSWGLEGVKRDVDKAIDAGDAQRVEELAAQFACVYPGRAEAQAWVASWRQWAINQDGMTEAEQRALLPFRVLTDDAYRDQLASACTQAMADVTDETPFHQAQLRYFDYRAFRCVVAPDTYDERSFEIRRRPGLPELGYWLDRRAEPPSELARAVYVLDCVGGPLPTDVPPKKALEQPDRMMAYAMCGHDARSLDPDRFARELEADLPPLARANAVATFALARKVARDLTSGYQALAQRDEDMKTYLFDAPEKAWKAWQASYEANRAAFEAAYGFEEQFWNAEASDTKATLAGCSKDLRARLGEVLAGSKARSAEDALAVVGGPTAWSLALSLAACETIEKDPLTAQVLMELTQQEIHRGPRVAAARAARDALVAITADRDHFPVQRGAWNEEQLPSLHSSDYGHPNLWMYLLAYKTFRDGYKGHVDANSLVANVVEKVTKRDGGVLVTWKAVTWKEAIVHCRETNKVDGIDSDGRLIYRQMCNDTGRSSTQSYEAPSVWIPASLAAGIAPGTFVKYAYQSERDPYAAVPLVVYANAAAKKAVAVLGFEGDFGGAARARGGAGSGGKKKSGRK